LRWVAAAKSYGCQEVNLAQLGSLTPKASYRFGGQRDNYEIM